MIDARFRPLPKWTRKPSLGYEKAHFRTAYNKALDLLEYELRKLNASDIFIEAGFSLEGLRNDGWPRGGQRPAHPGIVLYFKAGKTPMEFPCGTFDSFEANLYAIALTLEKLRAIDRYGVTLGHQQYLGFAALPQPEQPTVESAAEYVSMNSGIRADVIIDDSALYQAAYRKAAMKLHPDAGGGAEGFYRLGNAKRVLDQHHDIRDGGRQ